MFRESACFDWSGWVCEEGEVDKCIKSEKLPDEPVEQRMSSIDRIEGEWISTLVRIVGTSAMSSLTARVVTGYFSLGCICTKLCIDV